MRQNIGMGNTYMKTYMSVSHSIQIIHGSAYSHLQIFSSTKHQAVGNLQSYDFEGSRSNR